MFVAKPKFAVIASNAVEISGTRDVYFRYSSSEIQPPEPDTALTANLLHTVAHRSIQTTFSSSKLHLTCGCGVGRDVAATKERWQNVSLKSFLQGQ